MEHKTKEIRPEFESGAKHLVKEAGDKWMDFEGNTNSRFGLNPNKEKISRVIDDIIEWRSRISTFLDSSFVGFLSEDEIKRLERLRNQYIDQLEAAKRLFEKLSVVEGKRKKEPLFKTMDDYFIPKMQKKGIKIISNLNTELYFKKKITAKESVQLIKAFIELGFMPELDLYKGPRGGQTMLHKSLQKSLPATVGWTTFNKEYSNSLRDGYYDQILLDELKVKIVNILKSLNRQ